MKKIKQVVALAMCAVMATGVLTGCGNSESASGEETVNLTWYAIGAPPKDEVMIEEAINEYTKEKINATVDMKFIDFGDYTQKTSVIINSGEPFDIMFTCSWAGDFRGNASKGAFLELDEYLDTTGKGMYDAVDSRFWEGSKVNGKTFGVPTQKEIGVVPSWVFNKELVDKYNVPVEEIRSLEDLEPWLKTIKENEPDFVPLAWDKGLTPPLYMDYIMDGVGVEFDDETLTVKNLFETDKFVSTLKTMQKYYEAGYINEDAPIIDGFDKNKKKFVSKADGQPYADGLWSRDLGYEVVSNPITDTYITTGSVTGSMMAVSKNSKHPEKAIEFLNLLNTDPVLRNLANFGVEGVHYEKIGDNQIKFTDKKDDYGIPYFSMGNLYNTYVLDDEPAEKWEEFKKFNDEAIESPIFGFAFDAAPVANEVAAVNNALGEFRHSLFAGAVDVEATLAKLNEKLKQQGLDKIIEEAQKQVDAWAEESGKK